MSCHPTHKVESLIKKLNQRHELLIQILCGSDVKEEDLRIMEISTPHVSIKNDELRIAIDDFLTLLKEVKRYAK